LKIKFESQIVGKERTNNSQEAIHFDCHIKCFNSQMERDYKYHDQDKEVMKD